MKSLIAFFAHNKLLVNLLTLFVLISGIASFVLIRRELFPNISFDVITIKTIYPGASALDIEKAITIPLEDDLREVDSVRKMLSVSTQNTSAIVIQLDPDEADERKAKDDVQDIINRWEDLPEDAEKPIVTLIESKMTPVLGVSVSGPSDYLKLRSMAKKLERELSEIKGIAKVVPEAMDDKEIRVEVNPSAMQRFRVSLEEVISALKKRNISVPGGILEANSNRNEEQIIRSYGEINSVDEVRDVIVRANDLGQAIRLKDIATISLTTQKPSVISRTNGQRDIMLTLLKAEKADSISLTETIEAYLSKKQKEIGNDYHLEIVDDKSFLIKNRLHVLSENLIWGILLVILVLSLLLSFRVSLLVSLSIPLSFLATIIIFFLSGMTLNVVSLMGLIIVSGFLTDNAVVVVDNIAILIKKGMAIEKAVVEGTLQVWRSMTASTLGSVIAFMPMLFMTGIFGKVIFSIPLGVIIALLFSLFIGFFMVPSHFLSLIQSTQILEEKSSGRWLQILSRISKWWDDGVCMLYGRSLRFVVRRRYIVLSTAMLVIISIGIFGMATMKKSLFPSGGIEIFFIKTEAPVGSPLETHVKLLEPLEKLIKEEIQSTELINFWTRVGLQQQDVNDPETKRGSEYGQIAVYLKPEVERERPTRDIIEALRTKTKPYEKFFDHLTFEQMRGGPPVGKPVSLGVRGERFEDIKEVSQILQSELQHIEGVHDIRDSYVEGKKEIQVLIDHAEASAAGLSVASIGRSLFSAFEGVEATRIRELTDETKIRVMLPRQERGQFLALQNLPLQTKSGELIPLKALAHFQEGTSLASVEHEARRRQIKVTAEVNLDVTSSDRVNQRIRKLLPELNKKYPKTSIDFGGEDQDSRESFEVLQKVFGIAILGIFMVLILTFGSLLQPFLVLITIPFAAVSALVAFMIHDLPLSFLGTLGIIALGGVIVNNAIVLIDFVNQEREAGLDRYESIYEAGTRRLRAIFLSTITNIVGVLPTAYGWGGIDRFVVPIAIALGWGLAIGSVLTALLFPAALAILDDIEEKIEERLKRLNYRTKKS